LESAKIAFDGYSREKETQKKLRNGEIPGHLKDAVERMSRFSPTVRLRAKLNTEYIFESMQQLIFVSETDKKSMDGEDKKDYQALLSKISKDLPDLVSKIETGFGAKIVRKTDRKAEVKISLKDVLDEID
jgi:hypothetical protein